MDVIDLNDLKEITKTLEPVLRIGKFGLTDSIHTEIDKLLLKRELIKIKILNNSPIEDKDELINEIIAKSNALLVSKIGNVFSIYRKGKNKKSIKKEQF